MANSGVQRFRLPDVGEGLVDAEILQWYVKPGDRVEVNQMICEIETAKAAVELPSPFAGTVTELMVEEGATVDVGTPIIAVDDGTGGDGGAGEETEEREKPLVGYGEKAASTQRRARRRPAPAAAAANGAAAPPAAPCGRGAPPRGPPASGPPAGPSRSVPPPRTCPPVAGPRAEARRPAPRR
ncbi:biotin/lipoyl-containing protein, partial [Nocardiopsis composta]|uniref:biotin/lipoyl-containing protein n=1 Tax=Nocardiopsis composta TaxID=157465 RepID=UPI003B3A6531